MENELKTDLSNYKPEVYAKPSVTVDNIILQLVEGKFKVLLIKRKKPPFQNCWAFPGGFLDVDTNNNPDPSLEYAALRELKEETGIKNIELKQFKTYGDINRDPRLRVISCVYYSLISSNIKVKAADDASSYLWADINNLPTLAFDHEKILNELLDYLKVLFQYPELGIHFLPKNFVKSDILKVIKI